MDYQKTYDSLIDRARDRKLLSYKETHHIIPRCLGGTDEPENLVDLTAREHFLAHWLLVKIYPDNSSLGYAFNAMRWGRKDILTSAQYETCRKEFSKAASINMTGKYIGDKNPMYGKSIFDCWEEKYGKEISDRMKVDYKAKLAKPKGKDNPMFGISPYDRMVSKYGKAEADVRWEKMCSIKKEQNKGESNPFYGKSHSDDSKSKISKAQYRKFRLIKPDGTIIEESTTCGKIAKDHNLDERIVRRFTNKGKIPKPGANTKIITQEKLNAIGWEIIRLESHSKV